MKKFFAKPLTLIIACTVCIAVMASSLYVLTQYSGFLKNGYYYGWLEGTSGDPFTPGVDSDGEKMEYPDDNEEEWAADPEDPDINWPQEEQEEQMTAEINEVFHDQAGIYMAPYEPKTTDPVTIRLRADRYNITGATIYYTIDYGKTWKSAPMKFNAVEKNKLFDAWGIILPAIDREYYYYFKVSNKNAENDMYYGLYGMEDDEIKNTSRCFYVDPGHTTPDWSKGAYWYSLNVGSFYNGDSVNDPAGQYIDLSSNRDMDAHYRQSYTGDFKGVEEKLDYIKSYGVNGIYMNPIMGSWDIGGYGWLDPYTVATKYGNEQAFIDMVDAIHKNDMYICLDAVVSLFPDMGNLANGYGIYALDGAMQSKTSKYFDMFSFIDWPHNYVKRFSSLAPNYSSKIAREVTYSNKDSYLQRFTAAPYNADTYRFDSSIMLWGEETAKADIVADMRKIVKSINKDVLFMSENNGNQNYDWDSTWNLNYNQTLRPIAQMTRSLTQFKNDAIKYVNSMSRPAALSSYVYIEDVDQDRLRTTIEQQWRLNAVTMVSMTYLGAPALRFGNETDSKQTMEDKFQAFDWDESTWNYENNYFIRALGELRNEYSCLRDGVLKYGDVKDNQQLMTFARWDLKDTVITAVNRTNENVERELDVKQFGIVDGTVITDYLTGANYTVKNGKINVVLIPGGSILVTGGKTCSYRDRFEVILSKNGKAVMPEKNVFDITGKGSLDGKKDSASFALTPAFAGFELISAVEAQDGNGAFTVRASNALDAKAYSVLINKGKLTVLARSKTGNKAETVITADAAKNSSFSVVREANNNFYVKVNGEKLQGSDVKIEMDNKVFAGFAVTDGTVRFSNPMIQSGTVEYYADFEQEILSSAFKLQGDGNIESGKLELNGNASYLFDTHIGDFTIQSTYKSNLNNNGDCAGLAAVDASSDMIYAGRAYIGGKNQIVFGRIVNGELSVYASANETTYNSDITVQLQKIGNYFTMVYRVGAGNWKQLDSRIHSGMINPSVGAVVLGEKAEMSLEEIGFGNKAEGGSSINTPISIIDWSNKSGNTLVSYSLKNPSWRILTDKDNWEYTTGGIRQNSTSGTEIMLDTSLAYGDFRAEATLKQLNGDGYTGMILRKKASSTALTDGYVIRLDGNKLALYKGSTKREEISVDSGDTGLRIVAECIGNKIAVYYGQDTKLAFNITDSTYKTGYFGLFTSDMSAIIGNYEVTNLSYNIWVGSAGSYPASNPFSHTSSRIAITPAKDSWATASYKGFAYTDFTAQVTVTSDESGYTGDGYIGFAFGADEGIRPNEDGTVAAICGNKAVIMKNGEILASEEFTPKSSNILKLVTKEGKYKLYVNNKLIVEYTDSEYSGGTVSLAAYNTKGTFMRLSVKDGTN